MVKHTYKHGLRRHILVIDSGIGGLGILAEIKN